MNTRPGRKLKLKRDGIPLASPAPGSADVTPPTSLDIRPTIKLKLATTASSEQPPTSPGPSGADNKTPGRKLKLKRDRVPPASPMPGSADVTTKTGLGTRPTITLRQVAASSEEPPSRPRPYGAGKKISLSCPQGCGFIVTPCSLSDVITDTELMCEACGYCIYPSQYPEYFRTCQPCSPEDGAHLKKLSAVATLLYDSTATVDENTVNALITEMPFLLDRVNPDCLSGVALASFLLRRPEFITQCLLDRITAPADWVRLLIAVPALAHNGRCWKSFRTQDWVQLLTSAPGFAKSCRRWKSFRAKDWVQLLSKQPSLAKYCGLTSTSKYQYHLLLQDDDWVALSAAQPCIKKIDDLRRGKNVAKILATDIGLNKFCDWSRIDGQTAADILTTYPDFLPSCTMDHFTSADWAALLAVHPTLSSRCNWNDFAAAPLAGLLKKQPSLVESVVWTSYSGDDWVVLLDSELPVVAAKCQWSTLNASNWLVLLAKHPQYAQQCGLALDGTANHWQKIAKAHTATEIMKWKELLQKQPAFRPFNALFAGGNVVDLLTADERYAKFCAWDLLSGNETCSLLMTCPKYENLCNLTRLSSKHWVELLIRQPQLSDLCPWQSISGPDLLRIINNLPRLAHTCDLKNLGPDEWASFLIARPDFVDHCHCLAFFSGQNWASLLAAQPSLAPYCGLSPNSDANYWTSLADYWPALLAAQPQFQSFYDIICGNNIESTLSADIRLAKFCPWGTMSQKNRLNLLLHFPKLAHGSVLEHLSGKCWVALMRVHQHLGEVCKWNTLSVEDWRCLLEAIPEYATKCDWTKLGADDWVALLLKNPAFGTHCNLALLSDDHLDALRPVAAELYRLCKPTLGTLSPDDFYRVVDHLQWGNRLDWSAIDTGKEWLYILKRNPGLAPNCDAQKGWDLFSTGEWAELVASQPCFATKCPWRKLSAADCLVVLAAHPELAALCPCSLKNILSYPAFRACPAFATRLATRFLAMVLGVGIAFWGIIALVWPLGWLTMYSENPAWAIVAALIYLIWSGLCCSRLAKLGALLYPRPVMVLFGLGAATTIHAIYIGAVRISEFDLVCVIVGLLAAGAWLLDTISVYGKRKKSS